MTDETKPPEGQIQLPGQLKLNIDDATAMGAYSNFQVVGSNETEFVLDFAYIPPSQRRGKVRSRIILSPKHAKAMLALLQQRVADHESRYGPIALPRMAVKGGGPGGGQLPN
jgi:hypothetical protein